MGQGRAGALWPGYGSNPLTLFRKLLAPCLAALQAGFQQVSTKIGEAAAFVVRATLQPLQQRFAHGDIDPPGPFHRKTFGHDRTPGRAMPASQTR